ncbi:cytochrome c [uncultured Caulobacter sp.]|uniref:c-type cytochrome n=1 Tax=uncultured Caulobacter sp. TaxID=158749 RepID=UPI00260A79F3|nr:cytochrome c [uncultured Caulobacter sp.]
MRRWILTLTITTMLAGSAVAQTAERPGGLSGNPAAGGAFARKECSTCHAVAKDGVSPRLGAPTFGEVARKYADYRLDWELEAIAKVGHYAMPPKTMTSTQIADVTAYIRSLDDGGERRKRGS